MNTINPYTRFRRWQTAAFVFIVILVVLATGIEASAQDATVEPTDAAIATEAQTITIPVVITTKETPAEETTDNTTEIVALLRDVAMWILVAFCLFIVRGAVPPSVTQQLIDERRERARETKTSLDDLLVELAAVLLPKLQETQPTTSSTTVNISPPLTAEKPAKSMSVDAIG